ncbi:MAG: hypothetical protein AAB336_04385 [Acidobacteriota bacterium]
MDKNQRNGKRDLKSLGKETDEALKKATREALKKHKLAGNSIAIWKDDNVILISSDEINLELK